MKIKVILIKFILANLFANYILTQTDDENFERKANKYTLKVNDQEFSLTKNQYDEFYQIFETYDNNKDGFVDRKEIANLSKLINGENSPDPPEEEISEIIDQFDYDQDGILNFSEFISLVMIEVSKNKNIQDSESNDYNNNEDKSQQHNQDESHKGHGNYDL